VRRLLAFDWHLWFLWIMATAWGWILGRMLFPGIYIAAAGVAVAALQWLVLRRFFGKAAWTWAAASVAGWAVGWLLALLLGQFEASFAGGVALGAGTGTAQWLILRKRVHWSGWWVAISVVGWSSGLNMALAGLLAGVIAGAVTGLALELLLRHPLIPVNTGGRQPEW